MAQAQAVRRVLVESFTQASCGPCAAQNPAFNALLQGFGDQVVLLKYQTSWPGFDPMNQQNPTQVASRVTYYGVTGVPNVRLDGVQNAGVASAVTATMINNRLAQSTPIDMQVEHYLNEALDSIFIQVRIMNLDTVAFNPSGVVLHTAIIEKRILFPRPPGSTNERDFKSVMRRMLPDVSGAPLDAIAPGDTLVVTYAEALPNYIYNYAQIGVVAFVQKTSDRQVYQAAESLPRPLGDGYVDIGIIPNSIGPNGFCDYRATPRVHITNDGLTTITDMVVGYTLNNGEPVAEFWEGELAPGDTILITFPEIDVAPGTASFDFFVEEPNNNTRDYNVLNELITSQNFYTLNNVPVGNDIAEDMEAAPLRGTPAGTLVIKEVNDHFMVVNRTLFSNVTQNIGGFGASAKSMFTNFYDWVQVGAQAHMIFERIDLSGRTNNYLRFDRAHAQYQTSADRLRISISTDCGETWTQVYNKAGAQLATRTATNSRFIPTVTQWATDSISLAAYDGLTDINIRFTVVSDYGNNLFIDNIRVNEALVSGTDEPGLLAGNVRVYPNPAAERTRIEVNLTEASPVHIAVYDLSGKLVETLANGVQLGAGLHPFDWAPKAQGVFLVRVATDSGAMTQRVTVVK